MAMLMLVVVAVLLVVVVAVVVITMIINNEEDDNNNYYLFLSKQTSSFFVFVSHTLPPFVDFADLMPVTTVILILYKRNIVSGELDMGGKGVSGYLMDIRKAFFQQRPRDFRFLYLAAKQSLVFASCDTRNPISKQRGTEPNTWGSRVAKISRKLSVRQGLLSYNLMSCPLPY